MGVRGAVAGPVGTTGSAVLAYLERASEDRSGIRSTIAVAICAALVAIVAWIPISYPVRALGALVPNGTCLGVAAPLAYLCSAKAMLLTLVAPALLLVVVFVLRKRIAQAVRRNVERVPPVARFLAGPSIATILFALTWTSAHATALQWGIVPQILFPALVGLFGWITVRWNGGIQARLSAFFARRDALSRRRRFAIAAAVPALLGIVLGLDQNGFQAKEQILVLVGLGSTYLALVPRHGGVLEAIEEVIKQ